MRALVVEDSPTQAEALQALLVGAGYAVEVASRGEEGLARFHAGEFDVVISDIVMPGEVDGYELCHRIKTGDRRETPVILLTSLSDPLDIIRGLECGADNFFTKAIEPEHLLERLQLLLATRETRAHSKLRMGVKVFFLGREFTITSEREQILDLLISTFEDAVHQNRELRQREAELNAAKEELSRYAGSLQERLQQVVASSSAVFYTMEVSPDGFVPTWVSDNITRLMGYEVREVLTPEWRTRHLHPEDGPDVAAASRALLRLGHLDLQYRFQHQDGSYRWVHDQARLVRAPNGPGEAVGVLVDITPQRRLEEQLRQAQKMDAIGRLAGGIAHDFNNLLTVITSYSSMLLEDIDPDDPRRKDVEEVKKAATSAAGLTRQLLAFSKQQVLEPRVLDLNVILTGAEKLLKRLLTENIEMVTALAPGLAAVKADPGQLEQVIVNLAVNARDAMPDGGKLTIETANVDLDEDYVHHHAPVKPGPYVMLAVSDTGIGMDEQTQRRIFEPFFTTKEPGKGTGLGLATVYGIVKQSGGFIWVYSEPGHGTTFKLYLPRVEEPVDELPPPAAPTANLRGTETILLVEDAPAVRAATRGILDRLGYAVLEAENGEAAVRVAAQHRGPIHLLLTDVVMPEMGGRQLAEQLRGIRSDLKVLYASGYTDDAVVRHGVLKPGTAYLQKPYTPEILARKVRGVLDGPMDAGPGVGT